MRNGGPISKDSFGNLLKPTPKLKTTYSFPNERQRAVCADLAPVKTRFSRIEHVK